MTATPITDADTLRSLAALAIDIRITLDSHGDRFTLGVVDDQIMVGYLDEATGAFIAATIEDRPEVWVNPARVPQSIPVQIQPPLDARQELDDAVARRNARMAAEMRTADAQHEADQGSYGE